MKDTDIIRGPIRGLKKRDKNETYETGTILIPELEEAALVFKPRDWSDKEKAIIRKYYGKVPKDTLMKYLPGRTTAAIRSKAQNMEKT